MLRIINNKDVVFNQAFRECEVEYNLLYRILEDEKAFVIQSQDHNFIAAQNEGKAMWIWINPAFNSEIVHQYLNEFYDLSKGRDIPSVTGYKVIVAKVAKKIAHDRKSDYKLAMGLIAYSCPEVTWKKSDSYQMIQSKSSLHLDIISNFLKGFIQDAFGDEVTEESQSEGARKLIKTGNLYLLEAEGRVVAMANIAHKTKRYGRINAVYTPVEHRNKGYATAIVAKLSRKLFEQGLIPMLYTDDTNNISNRVYTNIGFCERGRIEDIKILGKQD